MKPSEDPLPDSPEKKSKKESLLVDSRKWKVEGEPMRSVKIKEPQADMVKDLKRYLKEKEDLSTTEAEILSRSVDIAVRKHYDELVEELKSSEKKEKKGVIDYILENPKAGEKTDAAEDHSVVEP